MDCFIVFIIVIVIMYVVLRISITISENHSNNNSEYDISELNNKNYYDNLPDDYYEFEDKYSDRIDKELSEYSDYCDDTSAFFDTNFNIDKRIKKLQNCIYKMDKIKNYYCNLGENGKILFEKETKDYFKPWSKNNIIVNTNGDNYRFEFDKIQFSNYNFLTYLLGLYTNDREKQKIHLEQEEKYYKINEFGGTNAYEEKVQAENGETEKQEYLVSIKKTIIKKLQSSDNIIQSKLINEFIDEDKYYVRKILKEMEANSEIAKEKQGKSYIIRYIKNTKN